MRERRIKIPAEEAESVHHVMSREVDGAPAFDNEAKEVLRRLLRDTAEGCGLQLLTHAEMDTHFHGLVRVPKKPAEPITDAELLRRYRLLHPAKTRRNEVRFEILEAQLAANTPYAAKWREQTLRLMGDISPYMKLVKQRFSIWFNKKHDRFGTLWAERFKSVLVEPSFDVMCKVATYIDLNAVRAGIVADPKDYRFCGYAEAVAGDEQSRRGIAGVLGPGSWDKLQAEYRTLLFTSGSAIKEKTGAIAYEALQKVLREGGTLPLPEVLRCKVRYFTQGAVLGTRAFVAEQLVRLGKSTPPRPLPAVTDWGDLAVLRNIRRPLSA